MSPDPSQAGRRALAARARRVATIRRRVAAAAVGAFALVWGLIAATGSMGAQTAATAVAGTTSRSATDGSSDWSTSQSSGSDEQQTLPAVTTGQS
jgi:hypothetical protein